MFTVNFEHIQLNIQHINIVFLSITLNVNLLVDPAIIETIKKYEICSKLTIKTPERSGVFMINIKHILHLFLMFPLLTLTK